MTTSHPLLLAVILTLLAAVCVWIGMEEERRLHASQHPSRPDTFASDVPIEKRHYYGTLTDAERQPVSYLARQLIMRPGASAIWHGTKLEERITIVAPRENA